MPNPLKLAGVRGGTKRMWLTQHRDFIIQYYNEFGNEATRRRFHLKQMTLDRLLTEDPPNRYEKVTKAEVAKLKADAALNAISALENKLDIQKTRVDVIKAQQEDILSGQRELKQLFDQFVESTADQVKAGLIIPLMQNLIQFSGNLPDKPNPIAVDSLIQESKKIVRKLAQAK